MIVDRQIHLHLIQSSVKHFRSDCGMTDQLGDWLSFTNQLKSSISAQLFMDMSSWAREKSSDLAG